MPARSSAVSGPKSKKSAVSASAKAPGLVYRPEYCARLLAFFDVPPFKVTEVLKKDGSVSLVETAS